MISCSGNTSGSSLFAHAKSDDGFLPIAEVQTRLDLCYLHNFALYAYQMQTL